MVRTNTKPETSYSQRDQILAESKRVPYVETDDQYGIKVRKMFQIDKKYLPKEYAKRF